MAGPTDLEQLMLEYINAARLNPLLDASHYLTSFSPLSSQDASVRTALSFFGVSGSALQSQFGALVAAQPVAWSETLAAAARAHNQAMIKADDQQHQLAGEADLGARATAAGYNWNSLAENIYAYAQSILYGHAGFMVDWGTGTNGIQSPPGHRINIMNTSYREVGVGVTAESNASTQVGPLVITEDFGSRSGTRSFILGVAYLDANDDNFYSVGEGRGDLTVAISGGGSAASWASGGYTLETTLTGARSVTFNGGGLSGPVTAAINLASNSNVKIDVVTTLLQGVATTYLMTSTSANVSGAVRGVQGLGTIGLTLTMTGEGTNPLLMVGAAGDDVLTTGSGADGLYGGLGNDIIDGGAGTDVVVYNAASTNYTWTLGSSGWTVVDNRGAGFDGTDTLRNIEVLTFTDRSLVLGGVPIPSVIGTAFANVLRETNPPPEDLVFQNSLAVQLANGQINQAQVMAQVVQRADATTAVATIAYAFFTGSTPSAAGLDYLVAPNGPNQTNLNSTYYQSFNLENRYINFAVNLGKLGAGAASFQSGYGGLSLFDATKKAYGVLFGGAPTDAKVHALIDSRVDYFAYYGQDGANGIGTKAAMVGWLMAEAQKADIGLYARANNDYMLDLTDGAPYAVNLVGAYGLPSYNYNGG